MIKSNQIRVVFHQPLGLPHVRMYATAEFGRRRLPASKGADKSRSGGTTRPTFFSAIFTHCWGYDQSLPIVGKCISCKKYMLPGQPNYMKFNEVLGSNCLSAQNVVKWI